MKDESDRQAKQLAGSLQTRLGLRECGCNKTYMTHFASGAWIILAIQMQISAGQS
jgi:hypothetical protein